MYLSELKLHGFKSFAERTTLQFAPGITAIVGPNGCGKSNIVDAVRWVIGEQRPTALRSEKMENVIFNGTSERRPLGMAEVELVIENNRGILPTEYTDVAIGRRLFRSGDSEYLMNGSPCRLKDITGLFMDTGMGADAYSVIELKMIDEILSDSAEDRRRLFEEAAGITRYKLRRRQALRKLDITQADLTRLRDLVGEIAKSVRRLERQAAKAARFKKHQTRLHELELKLARAEYTRLSAQRRTLQRELSTLEEKIDAQTDEQQAQENRLDALRRQLDEREEALAARRADLQEHREAVRSLEAEARLHKERLETARRDRDRLLREQEEARARRADLQQIAKRLTKDLDEAEPARHEAEAALDAARDARDATRERAEEKREALRMLRRREQEADDQRAEHRRALDRLISRIELLEDEQRRVHERLGALEENAGQLEARVQETATAREEAQATVQAARAALEKAEAERREHRQALDAATAEVQRTQRQHDAASAEVDLLESLVASYEEFSDAVQFLAATPDWTRADALRTVADVLACDEADRLALDAALGDLAACLLVESEAEARQALRLLHKEEKGQATFLILDRLPDAPLPFEEAENAQPLRAAVRVVDPAYAPLADVLLRGCYLSASLEEAQAQADAAEAPARFYTRAGEWAGPGGLLHGGPRREGASPVASRLGRREQLEAARQQQARLASALEEKRRTAENAEAALAAAPVETRRASLEEAEAALREVEKSHERLAYEHRTLADRRTERADRLEALHQHITSGRAEVAVLQTAAQEAADAHRARRREREAAEETFQQVEVEHRRALDRFSEANVAAVEARNRLDNLRRDLERAHQRLTDLDARAEARTGELEALRTTIAEAQEKQAALRDEEEKVRARRAGHEDAVQTAEAALAETRSAIDIAERRLRALRQEREETMRAESKRAVRLAEVKTRLQDLTQSIEEDFGQTLSEAPAPPEDFDEAAVRSEVTDLRGKIGRLGSVNPLALEEYEEEKERLDFLQGQQEDLERAEGTLLETIREINTTAARRFSETFDAIQQSFSGLFVRLFGEGASARLELEDEGDPLESTIEIIAQPRGKKPSLLAQLSSGEKALTAIALLFSIYLVKPSPFCILDEVDAPLDDANTDRFMQLIREFSDETQFILVTHNKRTMELADRMYGITMQEQGVSKLVGVEFEEAAEMADAA